MKRHPNALAAWCLLTAALTSPLCPATETPLTMNELGWTFAYDDADRVVKITDPAGRDTRFEYSLDDETKRPTRQIRIAADGTRVVLDLDADGRIQRMTDAAGSLDYDYDQRGLLTKVQRDGGPAITYSYDPQGRLTGRQIGDFFRLGYGYDFLGRLAFMETPAGRVEYSYETGQGTLVRTLPNGVKTLTTHAPNGQLSQITHGYFPDPKGLSYRPLAAYRYGYRPDGLIEEVTESTPGGLRTTRYDYDTSGRLIRASGPDGQTYAYAYDPLGNRLEAESPGQPPQTAAFDWAGRLTSLNGQPTAHDDAGNLTTVTSAGSASMSYAYNADSRLAGADNGRVGYRYDGEGRLIARTVGGHETRFIPDPLSSDWQPLVMEGSDGSRTLVVWDGDAPLLLIKNGQAEFLLHDHLGSVRLVTDAQGQVAQRFDYEPFGAFDDAGPAMELAPRFAGLFWDAQAQAYLTLARGYRPDIGRFLQIDPYQRVPGGSQKDLSLYPYCGNDAVNFVDRDGHAPRRFDDRPPRFLEDDLWWKSVWRFYKTFQAEVFERLEKLPGKWGHGFAGIHDGLRFGAFSLKTLRDVQSILKHPGDPASDWRMASIGLSGYSAIGGTYGSVVVALPAAAGGLGALGGLAHSIGDATRGRVLQNRAEALSDFGGAVLDRPTRIQEDYDRDQGHFSVEGDRYSTQGGWSLRHSYSGWLQKNAHSQAWALSRVDNLRTMDGSRISGTFSGDEVRDEYGKSLFTLYEPTSSTIRRYRHESYRISRGGGQEGPSVATDQPSVASSTPATPIDSLKPPVPSDAPRFGDDDLPLSPPGGGWDGGWGGPPPPGGGGGGWGSGSAMSPSPVGGVYLGGAGQALEGLGLLDGVAQDANGNLVLLGKTGDAIKLPPLRLDDVVTVFRSVYLNGEGPTVTIDPDPEDPEHSAMIIRHSPATDGTYVGWVLYQADRLMKGYNLGRDNLTKQDVDSAVPGYASLLDTIYFGGGQPGGAREGGNWERFWIVPAESRRFAAVPGELTLLDVPLELRTQPMKWEKGALVDDRKRAPSTGAQAFTDWFTAHYEGIAGEQFLVPPPESGITDPVPVFSELQRIALLTAIAETLRDQGVPLPFWMRDYEVRAVPFEQTTPALEIERTRGNRITRIFGGVSLSPPSADVKVFTRASGIETLPKQEQAAAREALDRSVSLAQAVREQMPVAEPLLVTALAGEGAGYRAFALPGGDTRALAPARLDEADLVVPVEGSDGIRLVRSFNSFFNPSGPWGQGWALDLPRLDEARVPERRDAEGAVSYRIVPELTTPLNSLYARFSRTAAVPELKASALQVPDQPGEFLALAAGQPDFLSKPTHILIRKDGELWHFSEAGNLVATERSGFRTLYERDAKGRVTRILGLQGKQPVASIRLTYDEASGRLQAATGQRETGQAARDQDQVTVRYDYDADGKLIAVRSDQGRTGYRYEGTRVAAITYRAPETAGEPAPEEVSMRRFEYDPRGQLLSETDAAGALTAYRVVADATGRTITAVQEGLDARVDSVRYDPVFRPIEAQSADGTKVSWTYPKDGGTTMTLAQADGGTITMTESADLSQRTLVLDQDRTLVSHYDSAGRLTSLTDNGALLLRQAWSPNGHLTLAANETTAVHPDYDADGLLTRVLVTPPEEQGPFTHWQETKLDPAGGPREINDYLGLKVAMDYDGSGDLIALATERDGKSYGYRLNRDASGRIEEVTSSWGRQQYRYDDAGRLQRLEMKDGDANAHIEWEAGQLARVNQFDGGTLAIDYDRNGPHAGRPEKITTPNALELKYEYDASQRLTGVDVGGQSRLTLGYDGKGRLAAWTYSPARP